MHANKYMNLLTPTFKGLCVLHSRMHACTYSSLQISLPSSHLTLHPHHPHTSHLTLHPHTSHLTLNLITHTSPYTSSPSHLTLNLTLTSHPTPSSPSHLTPYPTPSSPSHLTLITLTPPPFTPHPTSPHSSQPSSGGDRPPSPLSAATFNLPSVAPTGTLAAGSIFSAVSNTASILLPAFPGEGQDSCEGLGKSEGHDSC